MFQYAFARTMSIDLAAGLTVDCKSGFVRDKIYQRSYLLDKVGVKVRAALPRERIGLLYYKGINHLGLSKHRILNRTPFGTVVTETREEFIEEAQRVPDRQNIWTVGYWQSPKYFSKMESILARDFCIPDVHSSRYKDLQKIIRNNETVAVGIRLYEESPNPAAHAKNRILKGEREIRKAVAQIRDCHPAALFIIFSTSPLVARFDLGLPTKSQFLAMSQFGFGDTIQTLRLLSECKHHVLTNSTFYWWGAWLSEKQIHGPGGTILAANNFSNEDCLMPGWQTF